MVEYSCRFAHTPPFKGGPWHTIKCHTTGVQTLALKFAEPLGLGAEAGLAGLLHDLGKYGLLFQKRLEGKEAGIDHWTIGAWVALSRFRSVEAALSVQGHHIGLQLSEQDSLRRLEPKSDYQDGRRLSDVNPDVLLGLQADDGIFLPGEPFAPRQYTGADNMLRTRILFSTLVDADYLDTESHFAREADGPKILRPSGPVLEVDSAIAALDAFQTKVNTTAVDSIRTLRTEVSDACSQAAQCDPGIFTLTAPTGSGKTLAMLRFALLHAKHNRLRRIIVVLPFLTLIEQTASIYKEVFKNLGDGYVLEDHSLAREEDSGDDKENRAKLVAENWDAPIVITTNVRFFEALHHNRPSVCRKLHRICQSVVLCDEVQTLPLNVTPPKSMNLSGVEKTAGVNIVTPTLATLASLSADFKTSIVFATATQPAFGMFANAVQKICPYGWNPAEIISNVAAMFVRSARVTVDWRFEPTPWRQIADEVITQPGTLVIVNTRREAIALTEMIADRKPDANVLHLSTNMCVAHRQQVLKKLKDDDVESQGFLIATQCVEAGVDLDFCQVYRAWAPLDSIAQAAGRCNRNGRMSYGKVVVFMPENAKYPLGGYEQAVQAAMNVIRLKGPKRSELHDPELFCEYFNRLYSVTGIAEQETVIEDRIKIGNYVDVAKLYRLIPESGDNIVVRVGERLGMDHYRGNEKLLNQLEKDGLTGKLMMKLRPYTVSTFTNSKHDIPKKELNTWRGEVIPGWFLVDDPAYYDSMIGLLSEEPFGVNIT